MGYNQIDRHNNIGHLGYWLGQEYNGRGIVTESVRDVIAVGREYYQLNRVDIRCAVENRRSRRIPERLGFQQEGIIRQAEKLTDRYVDHVIYGLVFI